MTSTRLAALARGAALAALFGLFAAPAAWAQDKVKVGAYASVSDAPLYIALEKGYFKEQGLDVEITKIDSGATMNTLLATGDIDASGGSPGAGVYNAVRQGLEFRIVADKGSTHRNRGYFAFVVRKDLADQIKTVADLKGRSFALTGYKNGSSSEVTLGKLLATAGMTDADLKMVNMSFGDIAAALGNRKIEAAVLIEPLVTQLEAQNIATVFRRADVVYPDQQYGALMYGPGIIKRPAVADRFMVAYLKAARFYNAALDGKASKDELARILTQHTSVKDPALYKSMTYPGIDPDGKLNVAGMNEDVRWWHANGRMKELVNVSNLVDEGYIARAKKTLDAAR